MSEYQSFQWKRFGCSLTREQRSEVSSLSSHIDVTSDSAIVTYYYGDFKHDPIEVLKRYFDVFVYNSNWGMQQVAWRFDPDAIDPRQLRQYTADKYLSIRSTSECVILDAHFWENWTESGYDEYQLDNDALLAAMEIIYERILDGDFRAVFLLWLEACELLGDDFPSSAPIPAGLNELTDDLTVLTRFVGLDMALVKAAAESSETLSLNRPPKPNFDDRLRELDPEKKEEFLRRLLHDDPNSVKSALLRELRRKDHDAQPIPLGKIVEFSELVARAERAAELAEQREKEAKAKRRIEYLEEFTRVEDLVWARVRELIAEKKPKSYEAAVLLLRGLEDLWSTRNRRSHFLNAVAQIAVDFPRLVNLKSQLEIAGYIEPNGRGAWFETHQQEWLTENPLDREIDLKAIRQFK